MSAARRRGACPSLSAPMQTGDGLLVRLNPRHGALAPAQLAGIAAAARRHGNGVIEITSRGSLQIRGLSQASASAFAADVAQLGIEADAGPILAVGPLAGLGADERADPRPLAAAIRAAVAQRRLAERLAPKVSVIVDGGGALALAGIRADLRIEADAGGSGWVVMVGGPREGATALGRGDAAQAVRAAVAMLEALAGGGRDMRGRDLPGDVLTRRGVALEPASRPLPLPTTVPVGSFALAGGAIARGFALAFGQAQAADIARFAAGLAPPCELRLAPGGGLLVLGLTDTEGERLAGLASDCGLVAEPDDPRLRIVACAGAPGCASSHLPTKAIAATIAAGHADILGAAGRLHISGCAKQCARPAGPVVGLIGSELGATIVCDGTELDHRARRVLFDLSAAHAPERRRSA